VKEPITEYINIQIAIFDKIVRYSILRQSTLTTTFPASYGITVGSPSRLRIPRCITLNWLRITFSIYSLPLHQQYSTQHILLPPSSCILLKSSRTALHFIYICRPLLALHKPHTGSLIKQFRKIQLIHT